jgi:hypothetical protein
VPLANAVAVVHGLAVAFMLGGGLVVLRRPRVAALHAPLALAILGVHLAGADCPLTTLELWLREAAGERGYTGGFLGHYLFEPLGLDVAAPSTQVGVYTVALGVNAVAYVLLAVRCFRGSARAPRVLQNPRSTNET